MTRRSIAKRDEIGRIKFVEERSAERTGATGQYLQRAAIPLTFETYSWHILTANNKAGPVHLLL